MLSLPKIQLVDAPAIYMNTAPWEWVTTIPDYYNLWYAMEGIGSLSIDGESFDVREGEAYLLPPQTPVVGVLHGDQPLKNFTIHFRFDESQGEFSRLKNHPFRQLLAPNRSQIEARMQEARARVRNRDELAQSEAEALCFLILADLYRIHTSKEHALGDSRLEALLNLVDAQPGAFNKVEDLCSASRLSRSHLRRLFHERTQQSPIAYLTRRKLERACQLLSSSRIPIGEIAISLGYEDPFYFSRLFKRKIGCSPSEWRSDPSRI